LIQPSSALQLFNWLSFAVFVQIFHSNVTTVSKVEYRELVQIQDNSATPGFRQRTISINHQL